MFLPGITFSNSRPAQSGLSSRADVAMFVGCVARREAAVPDRMRAGLAAEGWSEAGLFKAKPERIDALLDIPVPVESWSEFDGLFAWERRPAAPGSADMLPTPLGLAVKAFFEEGGAKAYIVRTGDPVALADPDALPEAFAKAKRALLSVGTVPPGRAAILPGFETGKGCDPADPATWSGAGLIYAVDDAATIRSSPRIRRTRPARPKSSSPALRRRPNSRRSPASPGPNIARPGSMPQAMRSGRARSPSRSICSGAPRGRPTGGT
jgi:hypothetical protein